MLRRCLQPEQDNDGNVLATFSPEMQEVISASSAYKMLVMLRAVVNEGTGGRVRRLGVKADMRVDQY